MNSIRVILFDDKANEEDFALPSHLETALKDIDDRFELEWCDPVFEFNQAKAILSDDRMQYDIIFLDIRWQQWNMKDSSYPVDELISLALRKQDALLVLISVNDRELFDRWYCEDPERRPHAILSKANIPSARILRSLVENGFSSIGKPLKGRLMQSRWDAQPLSSQSPERLLRIAVEELLGRVQSGCVAARLRVLGGGLSGAATVLADATYVSGGQKLNSGFLLKVATDPRVIATERAAHRDLMGSWPTPLFATVVGSGSFGPYQGLAFHQVWAQTAEARSSEVLGNGVWGRIFTRSIAATQAKSSVVGEASIGSVLRSGLLGASRLSRFEEALADLGAPTAWFSKVSRALAGLDDTTGAVLTIQHCDLHTRNVLVSEDGAVAFVDAASMRTRELWCADLARFAVWSALSELDRKGGSVDQVLYGLGLVEPAEGMTLGSGNWWVRLRARVEGSLTQMSQEYSRCNVHLNCRRDWQIAAMAELARGSYSGDWFGRSARKLSAAGATRIADVLAPRKRSRISKGEALPGIG